MSVIRHNRRQLRRSALTMEACEARILMATGPTLGVAASFAVLGGTTVTNTGATNIVGNVGVSPGTSVTGFPPGIVSGGAIHAGDATATQAEADLASAYAVLAGEAVDTSLSGQDLGGLTLSPGVYNFSGAAQMSGALTLDAQGDPDAVFVIQITAGLTTATNSSVALINGAHAGNVYWQVGSSATIGSGTIFRGNILAFTSITLNGGASMSPGRALAINGAVTMDTNANSNVFTTPLTITAADKTKVYGAALPALTATYSGFINGDTSASLAVQPTLTTAATVASHVTGSPYVITAGGASSPYYTFSYVAGNLAVTAAPLTVTADDLSRVYNQPNPTLTASYAGFVNGDTSASLATSPTLSTPANAASLAGTYAITAGGAFDPDYAITHLNGTLTVNPSTLSGRVYLDINAGGSPDSGEPAMPGRVVFADLDGDGTLDPGEPTAVTDAGGDFTLSGNLTGLIPVREATEHDTEDRYVVAQTLVGGEGFLNIGLVPYSPIAPVPVVPNPFTMSPAVDPNAAFVQSLYHSVLGRTGGDSEVATWLTIMNSGMDRQGVAARFVNSLEHRENQVNAYYEEFLHRAPDPRSVDWVNELLAGVSEESVVESFLNSPEYQAAHQDQTLFIHDLYLDVLGREGDPTGVASWQAALDSGLSRQEVEADFVRSHEAADQLVNSFYATYLHRRPEHGPSDVWVAMLEAPNGSATEVVTGILVSIEYNDKATTPWG